MPEPQQGDLMAQAHGVKVGGMRLCELAEKYGPATLKDAFVSIQYYAAALIRGLIAAMPDGEYVGEDFVDGDGQTDKSFKVKCTMIVKGDKMTFDFSGSDTESLGFINSHWGNVAAHTYSAVMAMLPDCPNAMGLWSP